MKKKTKSGFSLLEFIITLGITSMLGLVISSLVGNLFKHAGTISIKLDRVTLSNQIISVLKKTVACKANLAANTVNIGATPSLTLTTIRDYDEAGTANTNIIPGLNVPIYPRSALQVSSIRFTGPTGVGIPALVKTEDTSLTYLGNLRISFVPIPGEVSIRPLVIPSVKIKTDLTGVTQNCALEKAVNLLKTCEDVLGLTKDIVTGNCVVATPSAKAGLCQSLGGLETASPWSCQLPTIQNGLNCKTATNTTDVVVGYTDGTPNCLTPVAKEVWSGWGPCSAGTKTRICLIGICAGSTTATCP